MRKAFSAAATLVLLMISAPVLALDPSAAKPDSVSQGAANEDMEKLVCRRDSVVGSRVQKRRTCKTRLEWAKDNNNLREGWGDFMRRANGAAPNN